MSFDAGQLASIAPIVALTIAGSALLLAEAFGKGRARGYLMPLTLASLAVAFGLEVMQWGDAQTGVTTFHDMLAVDRFSIAFGALFIVGAALAAMLAPAFMREHGFEFGEFYALLIFATLGMLILAAATDLVTIFLGVETMSIAVYVLTGSWRHSPKSAEAAMKYFMVGAFATSVLLYGMALVYGASGSTSLSDIAHQASRLSGSPLFLLGALLIFVALGFKLAAVPFHMWAPDAYEGAPTPVTAFMAASVKAAGFAVLIRLVSTAFASPQLEFGSSGWATIFSGIAALTMTLGNLAALRQDNVKRMLAYSSIAHAGYLILGVVAISLVGADARGPLIYYLVAYTFTTIGSFAVVAWIGSRNDEKLMIDDWAGLGAKHPAAALAMTIFMLSLGGIPPTAGFFGKFYVFRAALQKPALVWLVVLAVMNSVVSVYYYLRVVTAMYFREAGREVTPLRSTSVSAALVIAAAGTLLLGLLPGWLVDIANAASLAP
ncbi:MAG TPA: NADH-quinone oxidoreductase subunit N [Polyangia bacterium]|jgi:NADH-quinone oxidoreductase subunit N|nr:NADH-quinone oxidoreductase subunit N [Polyangia bacterium]